jgi:hypothetical protein
LILEDNWISILEDNPEAVRKAFDFSWSSSDPRSSLLDKPSAIDPKVFSSPITLQVIDVSGTHTATATINGVVYNLTIDSSDPTTLQGVAGSSLEGFSFSHAMPLGTSATYNLSQGMGSQLLQALDPLIASDGAFSTVETKYKAAIEKIQTQLETFDQKAEEDLEKFRIELAKLGQLLLHAEMMKLQIDSMFNIK